MRGQKIIFKADGSKKMVAVNGTTVKELLAQVAPMDVAETEDGFEVRKE